MASGNVRKELSAQAANIIRVEYDNAIHALRQSPSFDHADLTPAQLGKLLSNLLSESSADAPLLSDQQRHDIIMTVQSKYPHDIISPVVQQVFANLSVPSGSNVVEILCDLGTDITSDPSYVRAVLQRFGFTEAVPPTDVQVTEMMSTLSKRTFESTQLCDARTLLRVLNSFDVNINWPSLIKAFDWPDRTGVDTPTLKLLIVILLNSPHDVEPHAVAGFWTIWTNSLYQLRLLDALLSLPADTFNFVSLPGRRIVTVDDVANASPTIKALAANVQGHTWNSLELFEVLITLGDSDVPEIRTCVREMLDKAVKISAELVHMGLLQVSKPWNGTQKEYAAKLLSMFLAGHPNHQLVFMRIWQIDPTYLTTSFRDYYNESPLNITRILDVAQDLKILDTLLDVRPFTFALDVAALASRREYLNLDKWLLDNINTHGAEFLHSVIEFLDFKTASEKTARLADPPEDSKTMALNPQTITIFLRILRNNASMLSDEDTSYYFEVRNACLQIHPRLMAMNLSPDSDQEPGFAVVTYSTEVENEVDSIYKQMYDESITIDQVIQRLKQAKDSTNPRDQEIFSCMLHFLFDEYKFFQSFYPPRELAMTGYLFGSLIQHRLVDYIPLGIAIRYVLDALQCPPETNLFKFGIQALSRFESRLSEWQPLCEKLLQIPHLLEARPDLAESARRALSGAVANQVNGHDAPFTAIKPDDVSADEGEEPEEEVSDKILFLVNNLAPSNFDAKVREMKERFKDEYARWFANYLVAQRVCTEPNNHHLYIRFLEALDRQLLFKFVLHETFVKSANLLNSEKTLTSSSERAILKNLGSWLGTVTLARNKPILHKNLSFKDLLLEGYDSNRLITAIPFVCKILEGCSKSLVFKPPNPWLMGVISLLVELYHFAELKLNLKFEIEFVCKSLDLDLDQVPATTILRNRPIVDNLVGPSLPEFGGNLDDLPIGGYDPSSHGPADSQLISSLSGAPADASRGITPQIESILVNLSNMIQISSDLAPLHTNIAFKRAVQLAVDRAVREIIVPVVERSVTIAGISTRELVSKDFASEPNEEKLRSAAHLMARKLAGSLALVTCKEPLKTNLSNHIRHFLTEHGFAEHMVPEPIITMIANDNIDLCCAAIEKAAMDRAVADVNENFTPAFDLRRRHREHRFNQPFWDPSYHPPNYMAHLPDLLRLKQGGVMPLQGRVYEDFASDGRRKVSSRPVSRVAYGRTDQLAAPGYVSPPPEQQTQAGTPFLSYQEALDRFNRMMNDLDRVLTQLGVQSLSSFPPNHELRQFGRTVAVLAAQSLSPDELALLFSQKVVSHLYKTPLTIGREMYVDILDRLCQEFPKVAKEAVDWLLTSEDERKYNVPVTIALIRGSLVTIWQEDEQLSKFIYKDPRPSLLNFTASFIRECLTTDPPVATRQELALSIEALAQVVQVGRGTEEAVRLLEDMQALRHPGRRAEGDGVVSGPESDEVHIKLLNWFHHWSLLYRESASSEKAFLSFIPQFTSEGYLAEDTMTTLFFRICMEASVAAYHQRIATGDDGRAFQDIDAFSRLIVMLIKYNGDVGATANADTKKLRYLTKILSIVVLVLVHQHEERGADFQQKPFFRFFSSLLHDLHSVESSLHTAYLPLLQTICDTFNTLKPAHFPGFAFSWMSLISHRLLMPKLLASDAQEGWHNLHQVLLALLHFLAPFLRAGELPRSIRDVYQGTLRIFVVLLHDFPDFLTEYHFSLCDAIPPRCVQMRNLITSAFPATLTLPDPYLRNVRLDAMPEMGPIPTTRFDIAAALKTYELAPTLEALMLKRGPPSFLQSLKDRLRTLDPKDPTASTYNLSAMNAVVFYIGLSSVAQAKSKSGSPTFVPSDPGVGIVTYLATNFDPEGQYHLLGAILLHLRYPNAHTHWFSSLMLHLFIDMKDIRFKEIMTRILLEHIAVHRPHPWGVMVTFIELLRNPKYEFWNHEFVRSSPEITLIMENIAKNIQS
ncbi:hypothetical protein M422DRAFT_214789 [Sphaerobolus stellatus SS14]|uniref:General negative regulator of transcription subunit 1 n=1 Tax=Sphaerobolus stellatus (strain SS14) TaxID=990650 RepID=A0A0C9U6J9_SPHS4|nr:hypothetical protein M422DRAFT_214789 [Sphaerobolus stellatus SS14]